MKAQDSEGEWTFAPLDHLEQLMNERTMGHITNGAVTWRVYWRNASFEFGLSPMSLCCQDHFHFIPVLNCVKCGKHLDGDTKRLHTTRMMLNGRGELYPDAWEEMQAWAPLLHRDFFAGSLAALDLRTLIERLAKGAP